MQVLYNHMHKGISMLAQILNNFSKIRQKKFKKNKNAKSVQVVTYYPTYLLTHLPKSHLISYLLSYLPTILDTC
jgi:hypothetical protein